MISRRALIGSAAAGIVATAAGIAVELSGNRSVRSAKQRAPNFSVDALGSERHYQLADFAGAVLLLNFWATWCAPCRVEMPWLARTYRRYRARGFAVLGVNMDDGDMPAVERFAREMGVTYPIARNNDSIVSDYGGIRFLPQSVLIGKNGEMLERVFGLPSTRELEAAIVRAISNR
jgi:thiol-disulfide isomerase/thioredoxin